jgi:hypothetical protein
MNSLFTPVVGRFEQAEQIKAKVKASVRFILG